MKEFISSKLCWLLICVFWLKFLSSNWLSTDIGSARDAVLIAEQLTVGEILTSLVLRRGRIASQLQMGYGSGGAGQRLRRSCGSKLFLNGSSRGFSLALQLGNILQLVWDCVAVVVVLGARRTVHRHYKSTSQGISSTMA